MTPYQEGRAARYNSDTNPYRLGTAQRDAWDDGFAEPVADVMRVVPPYEMPPPAAADPAPAPPTPDVVPRFKRGDWVVKVKGDHGYVARVSTVFSTIEGGHWRYVVEIPQVRGVLLHVVGDAQLEPSVHP